MLVDGVWEPRRVAYANPNEDTSYAWGTSSIIGVTTAAIVVLAGIVWLFYHLIKRLCDKCKNSWNER